MAVTEEDAFWAFPSGVLSSFLPFVKHHGCVAAAQGIEEQLLRLEEVAEMQADWRLQAEAQDEVERLLRST